MEKEITPEEYKEQVFSIFRNLKNGAPDSRTDSIISVKQDSKIITNLKPVTVADIENPQSLRLLSEWRENAAQWFPAQFKVTDQRTKKWLKEQTINKDDRMLFWIIGPDEIKYGHIGLYRINPEDFSCEIDNVMRGLSDTPKGIMSFSLLALMKWSFEVLENKALELVVFADNNRALALYSRCGFRNVNKIPLKKVFDSDGSHWEDLPEDSSNAERYNLRMRIEAKDFQ